MLTGYIQWDAQLGKYYLLILLERSAATITGYVNANPEVLLGKLFKKKSKNTYVYATQPWKFTYPSPRQTSLSRLDHLNWKKEGKSRWRWLICMFYLVFCLISPVKCPTCVFDKLWQECACVCGRVKATIRPTGCWTKLDLTPLLMSTALR